MIVMTKYKDIAVLCPWAPAVRRPRRIFILQGALIGGVGTVIGLALGYSFCYFADKYHLVPLNKIGLFSGLCAHRAKAWDGVWISAAAMAVSLLATIYPARNATRVTPVEVTTNDESAARIRAADHLREPPMPCIPRPPVR